MINIRLSLQCGHQIAVTIRLWRSAEPASSLIVLVPCSSGRNPPLCDAIACVIQDVAYYEVSNFVIFENLSSWNHVNSQLS